MKKLSIFFSCLFLLLVAVSSDSFAQGAGCQGQSVAACATRLTASDCVGDGMPFTANTVGTNCAWTAGTNGANGLCSGTAVANCSTTTIKAACNINCSWVVTGSANNNAFVSTMCTALKIVTGTGGKAFAAFAIISVGIGFFTGKVSWGLMIGVTCGIAAMFGAPTIVSAISGTSTMDCGN